MNPTLVHMSSHSATEDAIATANGYPLSSNGWAALEPRAAYDNRVAMMMAPQVVQGHTLQTNVGPLHYSSMTPLPFCFPPPRERSFPQTACRCRYSHIGRQRPLSQNNTTSRLTPTRHTRSQYPTNLGHTRVSTRTATYMFRRVTTPGPITEQITIIFGWGHILPPPSRTRGRSLPACFQSNARQ